MSNYKLFILNSLYTLSQRKRYHSFLNSLKNPKKAQRNYLFNLLNKNSQTHYGKKYKFSSIKSIEEYKEKVPLVSYDDIKPEIEMMKFGVKNVLSSSEVLLFEPTSGSSSTNKHIPFTRAFLNEIQNSTSAWIYDVYKHNPHLKKTKAYWSISPSMGADEKTKGNIPIGTQNDSEYFSTVERFFLKQIMAVNPSISRLAPENFRHETVLSLLSEENLGLISIWNPSFFTLLLKYIENFREDILIDFEKRFGQSKRFSSLKKLFDNKELDFSKIWPNLSFLSTWNDATAKFFIAPLKKKLPNLRIQGKGLFMTEGIISVPLYGLKAPILSIPSHFYEFLNPETKKSYLPNKLQAGESYIPIITTGSGLYRYLTNDLVRVEAFHNSVPLLSFVGRADKTVDISGEKLNEAFVATAIEEFINEFSLNPEFCLLVPSLKKNPRYILFLEQDELKYKIKNMELVLDKILRKNYHYKLCRDLKQLDQAQIRLIKNGLKTYESEMITERQQKPGDIKNPILDSNPKWEEKFNLV